MIRFFGFFVSITLFSCSASQAQEDPLKRRASLGIAMQTVTDSIAEARGVSETKGVFISLVVEDGTADLIGLQAHDILLTINDVEVNSIRAVTHEIDKYREGDLLRLKYLRNGRLKNGKAKAMARPMETSEFADVMYGSFSYDGNQIRTIMHYPKNRKKPPVVFYIQGYACQSIDLAYFPDYPTRKLIDDWVKAGYAVYRMEKPGMGDNQCKKGCFNINVEEEVAAFREGYKNLNQLSDIDNQNIFLFGHSIGGIIAPLLASEFDPKGVITYGTVVKSWYEYLLELTRVQGVLFHLSDIEIETNIRNVTPFWYDLLVAQKSNEELLENPETYQMLEDEGTLQSFKDGLFMERHYTYWTSIQNLQMASEWSKVNSHVLALYGEFDIQALNADHIYAIERIVNEKNPEKATAKVIKGADHGFVRFDSFEENVTVLNENAYGDYARSHYHSGVAESTISWMNDRL